MNVLTQLAAHHKLSVVTVFFALGIAAGHYLPIPPTLWPLTTLLLSLTIIALFLLYFRKHAYINKVLPVLLPLFATGLGLLHISSAIQPPASPDHLYNRIQKKQEAVLAGMMLTMPTTNAKSAAATIESQWIRLPGDTAFSPVQGRVLLRIKGSWPEDILPGDKVIVRANLHHPRSYHAPGAFDYARYLAQKNIWVVGFIHSPLFLRKGAKAVQDHALQKTKIFAERCRTTIAKALNASLPQEKAALYRAILLGDRSGISPEILENFKACGALHLLAISGLHLTVLWTLFYIFWYWLLSRSEYLLLHSSVHTLAALFTLPFIFCYAFLAGLQTPVIRATIMSSVLVIALLRRQKATGPPLLAVAALLILIVQPTQIFSPSFQLSFIAVATIFFLQPWLTRIVQTQSFDPPKNNIHNLYHKIRSYLLAGTVLSLGISLLTAPVTLFHFNRISLLGPLVHLLLEPLLCLWALPLGTLSLPFLYTGHQTLAHLFLLPGSVGLGIAQECLARAAALPFAFRWMATPTPFFLWGTLLFYLALLLFALAREKIAARDPAAEKREKRAIQYTGIAISSMALALLFFVPSPRNRVVFLDVGQGSATLIEDASGHTALIDGGGASFSSTSVGERVIGPYLLQQGKTRIDQIVLTHPDADHSNGLNFILANFSPDTLWLRAVNERHPFQQKLKETAEITGCSVKSPASGETLFDGTDSLLRCLYNFGMPSTPTSSKEKNRGIVLSAAIDNIHILFPGDIDRQAEHHLLSTSQLDHTEILLAAHHGSKTSNSPEFLNAIDPRYVVVSAGNKEGMFPSHTLLRQLKEKGKKILTTARNGTIEIEFPGNGTIEIYSYSRPGGNPLRGYRRMRYQD